MFILVYVLRIVCKVHFCDFIMNYIKPGLKSLEKILFVAQFIIVCCTDCLFNRCRTASRRGYGKFSAAKFFRNPAKLENFKFNFSQGSVKNQEAILNFFILLTIGEKIPKSFVRQKLFFAGEHSETPWWLRNAKPYIRRGLN